MTLSILLPSSSLLSSPYDHDEHNGYADIYLSPEFQSHPSIQSHLKHHGATSIHRWFILIMLIIIFVGQQECFRDFVCTAKLRGQKGNFQIFLVERVLWWYGTHSGSMHCLVQTKRPNVRPNDESRYIRLPEVFKHPSCPFYTHCINPISDFSSEILTKKDCMYKTSDLSSCNSAVWGRM